MDVFLFYVCFVGHKLNILQYLYYVERICYNMTHLEATSENGKQKKKQFWD